jgi:hypothetical protein
MSSTSDDPIADARVEQVRVTSSIASQIESERMHIF